MDLSSFNPSAEHTFPVWTYAGQTLLEPIFAAPIFAWSASLRRIFVKAIFVERISKVHR